ncbi:MAG: hypothetical protein ACREP2_14760 [Rhodanobacteraceae bacterium]
MFHTIEREWSHETSSFRGCPRCMRAEPGIHFFESGKRQDGLTRAIHGARLRPPSAFALAILPTQSGSIADEAGAGPGMTMWFVELQRESGKRMHFSARGPVAIQRESGALLLDPCSSVPIRGQGS